MAEEKDSVFVDTVKRKPEDSVLSDTVKSPAAPVSSPIDPESKLGIVQRIGGTPGQRWEDDVLVRSDIEGEFERLAGVARGGISRNFRESPNGKAMRRAAMVNIAGEAFDSVYPGFKTAEEAGKISDQLDVIDANKFIKFAFSGGGGKNDRDLSRMEAIANITLEFGIDFEGTRDPKKARAVIEAVAQVDRDFVDENRLGLFTENLLGDLVSVTSLGFVSVEGAASEQRQKDLDEERRTRGLLGKSVSAFSTLAPALTSIKFMSDRFAAGALRANISRAKAAMLANATSMGVFSMSQGGKFSEGATFGLLAPSIAKYVGGLLSSDPSRFTSGVAEALGFVGAGQAIHGFDLDQAMIDAIIGGAFGAARGKSSLILKLEGAQTRWRSADTAEARAIASADYVNILRRASGRRALRSKAPKLAKPEAPKPEAPAKEKVEAAGGEKDFSGIDPFTTSGKERVVTAERADRGLEPVERGPTQTLEQAKAKADEILAADPERGSTLASEIVNNPRPMNPAEHEVLLTKRVDIRKSAAKAEADINKAAESGDPRALADATRRFEAAETDLLLNDTAFTTSGSEAGRYLQVIKSEMTQDFDLVSMKSRRRAQNQGKELNKKQVAETEALHKEINRLMVERDAHAARSAELETQVAAETVVRGLARKRAPAITSPKYGESNRVFTKEAYAKTVAGVKQKVSRLSAGLDPTLLADAAKIGAYHIEAGARSFAKWSKAMASELGPKIKPHLRAIWNETRKQHVGSIKSAEGKRARRGLTDEQRIRNAIRAVKRSEAEFSRRIKEGDLFPGRKGKKTPDDPRLTEAKAQRDEVRKALKELQEIERPPKTREEKRLQAYKARRRKRIEELERRLDEGDFTPAPKLDPVARDSEAIELDAKFNTVTRRWNGALIRDRLRQRPLWQKAVDAVFVQTPNTARALRASFDLSAYRQAWPMLMSSPGTVAKASKMMIRALKSPAEMAKLEVEMRNDPDFKRAQQGEVFFGEMGESSKLSAQEEAYMGRWLNKVPIVAGSARAHITLLNWSRFLRFKQLSATLSRTGEVTVPEAKVLGALVNSTTGRGSLGQVKSSLALVNGLFFSTRLIAGRIQALTGYAIWTSRGGYRGTSRARVLAAKEYARMLMGLATVYGLVKGASSIFGADVDIELDPRSPDFGKGKVGNSRADLTGGMGGSLVLGARLATRQTKRGGKVGPLRSTDAAVGTFFRNKFAPAPALAMDAIRGKHYGGEPVTLGTAIRNLTVPMSIESLIFNGGDVNRAMREHGVPQGAALLLLEMLGVSVQNYEANQRKAKKTKKPKRRLRR